MRDNTALNRAKRHSHDSWYTTYESVEQELSHYVPQFVGKRVLCNADDPIESAFTCYFVSHFNELKLKSLTCIAYKSSQLQSIYQLQHSLPESYAIIVDSNGKSITPLKSGEFDAEEVIPYWENADIVCTNPPFSKFRQFWKHLQQYQCHYLIISNLNAVSYADIFPHIQTGIAKLGYNVAMKFRVSRDGGYDWQGLGTAIWLTDLQVHPAKLILQQNYNPQIHPKYDNQNIINVDKVADIPKDYPGIMGVPITYLRYHDPSQYRIIGQASHGTNPYDIFSPRIKGRKMFKRLLIQKWCSQ